MAQATDKKLITIVGGSGFLGKYVVQMLAQQGYRLRILSRHPREAVSLKPLADVGQIYFEYADLAKPKSLQGKLDGSETVINLVGKLYESGKQNFKRIHSKGAEALAEEAKHAGVAHFIQVSALGVENARSSKYARTKISGENSILSIYPKATIIRPSVLFGPEDDFYNQFGKMALMAPALPLIGGGKTLFQPVYVADVAKVIALAVSRPSKLAGIWELGGPDRISFKTVLQQVIHWTGNKRPLLPIPWGVAKIMGSVASILPVPPLTRDQVMLLQTDNVLSGKYPGFAELGIEPRPVSLVVPQYLARFRKGSPASATNQAIGISGV